jgi:hypothetical protein
MHPVSYLFLLIGEGLLKRNYIRENDGVTMPINLLLVDANFEAGTIRDFTRRLRSPPSMPAPTVLRRSSTLPARLLPLSTHSATTPRSPTPPRNPRPSKR